MKVSVAGLWGVWVTVGLECSSAPDFYIRSTVALTRVGAERHRRFTLTQAEPWDTMITSRLGRAGPFSSPKKGLRNISSTHRWGSGKNTNMLAKLTQPDLPRRWPVARWEVNTDQAGAGPA